MPSSPSLMGRALVAVALMIGFYLLAIGLAAGLLYIPYAEVKYARRLDARIALFCAIGAGAILWSLIPRRDKFVAPGPVLEPARQPRLFESLRGIARATMQEMPSEVYLVAQVNAFVTQRGGMMGFGSRRVMGLGLPLMQILTVSQLRAVLAHEFGHYYGGDTKLGPWIYKTRRVLGRTIYGLAEHSSVLQKPFLWYGLMFLRVTQAISRRQEFTADELASRTVGSQALVDGLRAVHGNALAFDAYWTNEVGPVLGSGFLPPLAEGFGRFVHSASIAEAINKTVEGEIKEGQANPYDTHPPLRERIAAVERLPQGQKPAVDPPAISLLDNLPEQEKRLLLSLADQSKVQALRPVNWEDVPVQVYVPMWDGLVREESQGLAGVTPGALPEIAKNLVEFEKKLSRPKDGSLEPEQASQRAAGTLGAAFALALHRRGWALRSMPGEDILLERDGLQIKPFLAIRQLASGELMAEAWQEQCSAAGISDLNLGETPAQESKN